MSTEGQITPVQTALAELGKLAYAERGTPIGTAYTNAYELIRAALDVGPQDWDATNCVRFCDRCEKEYGVGAGADKGDRACSGCGSESAPHIYPALAAQSPASSTTSLDPVSAECAAKTAEGHEACHDDGCYCPCHDLALSEEEIRARPGGAQLLGDKGPEEGPRCGGEPTNPGFFGIDSEHELAAEDGYCRGCPDCSQPPPGTEEGEKGEQACGWCKGAGAITDPDGKLEADCPRCKGTTRLVPANSPFNDPPGTVGEGDEGLITDDEWSRLIRLVREKGSGPGFEIEKADLELLLREATNDA